MNEVPASREMDLKLPLVLSRPSTEQQFDSGEEERRGRERRENWPSRLARTLSFQFKKIAGSVK
jgi:hypothetical protein